MLILANATLSQTYTKTTIWNAPSDWSTFCRDRTPCPIASAATSCANVQDTKASADLGVPWGQR